MKPLDHFELPHADDAGREGTGIKYRIIGRDGAPVAYFRRFAVADGVLACNPSIEGFIEEYSENGWKSLDLESFSSIAEA